MIFKFMTNYDKMEILPKTQAFPVEYAWYILPYELIQYIVTIPWIKHKTLFVCKQWHNFVYEDLPDANLN